MSSAAAMSAVLPCQHERGEEPTLQLLRGSAERTPAQPLPAHESPRSAEDRPGLRLLPNPSHVLIAGADPVQRASLLDELTRSMPPHTPFTQAGAISEVLERAPASRMVVLSGDLDDAPAESLVRLLGHRHPRLPIVSIDVSTPPSDLCAYV
jgi:hypothetical protein